VYREKSKSVREKWKMMVSVNVQFNGSALNLVVSRDEAILGPSDLYNELVAVLGPGETPPGIDHGINSINVLGIEVSPKEDMSMWKTSF
jgi:hypothetical protein